MNKWKKYFLCQIADIIVSNVDKHIREDELLVALCNYMDVYSNRYLDRGHRFSVGSVAAEEYEKFRLIANDVIITKDSETPDDIGVPAVIIESIPDLVCGYHLAILRPKKELLDGRFLMQLLQADWIKSHFGKHANGSTRFGLSRNAIDNLECLIPDYAIQQKIASILAAADETIAATSAAIEKYKAIRQGLLQDLLPQQHSKYNMHFLWEVADITVSNVDKHIREDEQSVKLCNYMDAYSFRYLTAQNKFSIGTVKLEEFEKFRLRLNDVVITKDSETPDDIGVPTVVIEEVSDLVCGYHLAILRPKLPLHSGQLLMQVLQTDYAKKQFGQRANGSTRFGLTKGAIETIELCLPSEPEEQHRLASILRACDVVIEEYHKELSKLQYLKLGLMADLLSGRKTVSISEEAKPHLKPTPKHERV